MTVTESGEVKRPSSPDLSYVPLQNTNGDGEGGEERASSEESQQGNNNNTQQTVEERGALIPPQNRTGHLLVRSNLQPSEELAPLTKRDLATKDSGNSDNGTPGSFAVSINEFEPPDGGVKAWSVMIASFLVNGILFGIINSYSSVYIDLKKQLEERNETEVSSKASLVGSLTIGTTFLLSPVAGILTDTMGIQITTFVGGAIASSGMLLSCVFHDKIQVLYWTYGVMYGLGASLAYTPSLVILGHYFKRYMGIANGIVTAGSSIFTVIMIEVTKVLIEAVHLQGLFGFQAALTAIVMGCALLFKPLLPPPSPATDLACERANVRVKLKEMVHISIWKRKRYVVWASIIPLALFGYFVPYVHIGQFVEKRFKGESTSIPIMCIGVTSGIGRLLFGYIADMPRVNRVLLQQISFFSIGLLTMLIPITHSFIVLLLITLGMGLFDGCFISLLGPIAFDMCGRKEATQAIGFLLGMCAIPLILGPFIAGKLYDQLESYDLAFCLAGVPPIVGAIAMFSLRFVKEERNARAAGENGNESSNLSHRPIAQSAWQNEGKELQDMSGNGVVAVRSP